MKAQECVYYNHSSLHCRMVVLVICMEVANVISQTASLHDHTMTIEDTGKNDVWTTAKKCFTASGGKLMRCVSMAGLFNAIYINIIHITMTIINLQL